MRSPTRIPRIIGQLRGIWSDNPDLRLSQLILNLIDNENLGVDTSKSRLYNMEDDEFIGLIRKMYDRA